MTLGVTPDDYKSSISINGLCKNKSVDEVMNLFQEMHGKNRGCDRVTCNSFIDIEKNMG